MTKTSRKRPSAAKAPGPGRAFLLLLGPATLALSQPLYDLLGRSPEFFVAHQGDARDVWIVGAAILVLPLAWSAAWSAVVALAAAAGGRQTRWLTLGVVATLFVLALPMVGREGVSEPLAFVGAAAVAALAGWAFRHTQAVALFLLFTVPAVAVCPALFFATPAVRQVTGSTDASSAAAAVYPEIPRRLPVVLLVFDELPLASLVDADDQINGDLYPGFADLAAHSLWYRNATTVAQDTAHAVPAILTGRMPTKHTLAIAGNYPDNFFRLCGQGGYRLQVFEGMTRLCTDATCSYRPPLGQRLRTELADLSVLWRHTVLPAGSRHRLARISENWAGFAETSGVDHHGGREGLLHPVRRLEELMEALARSGRGDDPAGTCFYAHPNLPHVPWRYLPSGQEYGGSGKLLDAHGLAAGAWFGEEWQIVQGQQRHLFQVALADRLLQDVVSTLRGVGLFDPALVIVVADHGASFVQHFHRRSVQRETVSQIANIPFFVKLPGAGEGRILDLPARTVDVMPTIAEVLGVDLPWSVDGHSVADPDAAWDRASAPLAIARTNIEGFSGLLEFTLDEIEDGRRRAVMRRISRFGAMEAVEDMFAIGPARDLVGQPIDVSELAPAPWRVVLDRPWQFQDVRPDGPFLPAHVAGTLKTTSRAPAGMRDLAVVVNGVISATTRSHVAHGALRFTAMVPPGRFRAGPAHIRLIDVTDRDRMLVLAGGTAGGDAPGAGEPGASVGSAAAQAPVLVEEHGVWGVRRGESWFPVTNGRVRGKTRLRRGTFQVEILGWLRLDPAVPTPPRLLLFDGARLIYRGSDATETGEGVWKLRIPVPESEVAHPERLQLVVYTGGERVEPVALVPEESP